MKPAPLLALRRAGRAIRALGTFLWGVAVALSTFAATEPPPDAHKHWAFQPLRVTKPPTVKNSTWPKTDIDRFILARLERAGLAPAPPADPRTLIRRMSFDLTGLPP